jgi:hypothetical protein
MPTFPKCIQFLVWLNLFSNIKTRTEGIKGTSCPLPMCEQVLWKQYYWQCVNKPFESSKTYNLWTSPLKAVRLTICEQVLWKQ